MQNRVLWIATILFVVGCGTYTTVKFDQRYGEPAPRERLVESMPADSPDYWTEVKPVIEQRCVVCHGCYDAPCQLKLGSIEGIERGASAAVVYDQSRLKMAQPTRLFEDAQTVSEWRELGFHSILNEHADTPEANREASVMHRILTLKQKYPLPGKKRLPKSFDLSLNRKQSCPKPETFDDFAKKTPLWGMPYALPGLDATRQTTLLQWLAQGANYTARAPLEQPFVDEILTWETFLNGDSLKAQLTARYIYEHLFLAHLYFPQLDERRFFNLVRSATPPGEPVELISTRRPYNDPGVDRVYYHIVEKRGTIVSKTHMPYALDETRMERWVEWFVEADYAVTQLPSYDEKDASNPFRTFTDMPVKSRYEFMLEEAQFTIMSFIKGPVCRGQIALNVINDRFWVFFVNPVDEKIEILEDFLALNEDQLELPASTEDIYRPITHWKRYSKQQKAFVATADAYMAENLSDPNDITLNAVWDGDGINDNAALTVLRHFDSATVEKGLIGKPPKTAWLIGYPLLEKIHYLLVAGYDVFGNVGHQLLTRVYMDFLRMEGETNFLFLLPQEARERERAYWYREADKEVTDYMVLPHFESKARTGINYRTDDEKNELFGMLKERLAPVLPDTHDYKKILSPATSTALAPLEDIVGKAVTLMPQNIFIEITGPSGNHYATIVRNNAHLNITSLFGEKKFRAPDEDTLSVIPGFLGAYPNALFIVNELDLARFAKKIAAMRSEGDYRKLLDKFGVRRTSPMFWQQSDTIHAAYEMDAPVEYGLFDYNRLENR